MNTRVIECHQCGTRNRVSLDNADKLQPVCGKCGASLKPSQLKPVEITDANFASVIGSSKLPVILDLWAPWCGPCRFVGPIIDQLAIELAGQALVGKLNTDQNQKTAASFSVQGIPTILFLKNGQEVDRIVGAADKEAIKRRFAAIV